MQVTDMSKFGAESARYTPAGNTPPWWEVVFVRSLSLSLSLSGGWTVAVSPFADAVAPLAGGEIPAEQHFAQRNTLYDQEHRTKCELQDLRT